MSWKDESATRLVANPQIDPQAHYDLRNLSGEKDAVAGDLDRDGDRDVVVVRKTPFYVQNPLENVLLLNEGGRLVDRTPEFAPDFLSNSAGFPASVSRDVVLLDADGDGWLDICVANAGGHLPQLYLNQGRNPQGAFLGFVEDPSWIASTLNENSIDFCGVAAGDVNGDGLEDLFFAEYADGSETPTSTQGHTLLLNSPSQPGTFTDATSIEITVPGFGFTGTGTSAAIVDVDGDADLDIVYMDVFGASPGTHEIAVLMNAGAGTPLFSSQVSVTANWPAAPPNPYMITVADFTGDDLPDVYIVDDTIDWLAVNKTQPQGQLVFDGQTVNTALTASRGGNAWPTDFDRDGKLDLTVADMDVTGGNCAAGHLVVLNNIYPLSTPPGSVLPDPYDGQLQPWSVGGTWEALPVDVDLDGFEDILIASCDALEVFRMDPFPSGQTYCIANAKSAGPGATLSWSGSLSIAANDTSVLVSGSIPGESIHVLYGPAREQTPFGDGYDCVGGTTFDFSVGTIASDGSFAQFVDMTQPPASSGAGKITAGSTWHFQALYRDPSGPGGTGFNLSNGLSLTFAP